MSKSRPCKEFVVPTPEQKYGAYCGRCHYSREAHEKWAEWTAAAEPDYHEDYCDYCEQEGHTFRSCPQRDDGEVREQ